MPKAAAGVNQRQKSVPYIMSGRPGQRLIVRNVAAPAIDG
jgi:hypothetical protein